jgi:hypothetical protein
MVSNKPFHVPFDVSDGFRQTLTIVTQEHSPDIFADRNLKILVVMGGQDP